MIESLVNKGVVELVGSGQEPSNRIAVIGCARGGTSMVAGALHHLGIFMGDRSSAPVFEDVALSELFESQGDSSQAIASLVASYDQKAEYWGWKRPSSINYLDRVDEALDRPLYVFVFKDIFSIANRNNISMSSEVISGMRRALNEYRKAVDFIEKAVPKALLVSYDKAVLYPGEFVDALVHFAELPVSDEQRHRAAEFIKPNPSDYLDMSREGKSEGFIDHCSKDLVRGWARYLYNKKVAPVEVYVNGALHGRISADVYRKDLKEAFSQDCAFQFEFSQPLSAGDEVSVKVEGEIYDLRKSPFIISEQ